MQLKRTGNSTTELRVNSATILFSYNTPVAVELNNDSKILVTSQKYSKTTSKHINEWIQGRSFELVEQSVIDSFINV
jgi:hypothetical protein